MFLIFRFKTQNEMEMATKLQSAEHSVQLLGIQLAEKTEEMQKLSEQVKNFISFLTFYPN